MGANFCNAVVVVHKTGMTAFEDLGSIAAWGDRIEHSISVGKIDDPAVILKIAQEYLTQHAAGGMRTVVTEVSPAVQVGSDFVLGDMLLINSMPVRNVRNTFSRDGDNVRRAPEFETPRKIEEQNSGRALDRLIRENGGSTALSARPLDFGTPVNPGKVGNKSIPQWSWQQADDLDHTGEWQPFIAEEPCRMYRWMVTCTNDFAIAPSLFFFYVNGVPSSGLLNITLEYTEDHESVPLYAYTVLRKGDRLAPACGLKGGHTNGSIQFQAADVL